MDKKKLDEYSVLCANRSAEENLRFFIKEFGNDICFASSLGAEDQVITDMINRIDTSVYIFTLDTGRMFPETYSILERTQERYAMPIHIFFPDNHSVEKMVNTKGINLFYESVENRKLCCHVRKIDPLRRALQGRKAWICGLRREQSVTRTGIDIIEWDTENSLFKINPLYNWTEKQVWEYIREHEVPVNKLHDKGFTSIGCQPCTRAVTPGADIRSGRWWWENPENKECGLHAR